MFESVDTDAIVTLEVHNPVAFENAFRCRTVTLSATPLFVDFARKFADEDLSVVSADTGGAKRAEMLRETLEAACGRPVGKAFADKHRSAGIVSGDLFVGDVVGRTALIIDDLISTGGTLLRAARAARKAGARRVLALVTHGLFMPGAEEVLGDPAIERLVITDSARHHIAHTVGKYCVCHHNGCARAVAHGIARHGVGKLCGAAKQLLSGDGPEQDLFVGHGWTRRVRS